MPNAVDIQFPRLGVVRRFANRMDGYRDGYPTPWALNVRLEDSLTDRLRGGSFTANAPGDRPNAIIYRDRKLTCSHRAITASRVGDHTDFSLSSDVSDMLRPALFQFSEAAERGDGIVALVPHKDTYLLCFTATETWVQQGDPLTSPRRRISDQVGIIGPDAWCVAHDTVYFLSSYGLYQVQADGSGLTAVSEDKVPEDLTGITDATCCSACKLDYDHASSGVSIHLATSPSWFYDTAREGFWPFDRTQTDSHLLIGPLKLGNTDWQGLIQTLHGIVAEGSSTVNWRIVPGTTAEEAADNGKAAIEADLAQLPYSAYVRGSGAWTAGRSSTARPRTSAMFACIWLSSAGTWAWERMTMNVIPAGKWRA